MEKSIRSTDNINIHYTESGSGTTILAFVHGWLGNTGWWEKQQKHFIDKFKIVRIDLGGHGKSDKSRTNWTSEQYADDITTVLKQYTSSDIILVGHSMSEAYVVEASIDLPQVKAVVIVDTLRDLDQEFSSEQAEEFMFKHYRSDFKSAVENLLPKYLFVEKTPEAIKKQLQHEFLQNKPDLAINALSPLYEMDIKKFAKQTNVPVIAINSDAMPTNEQNNRKYFKNYDLKTISEVGHYPMLEKPDEFNTILDGILDELSAVTE